MSQYLDAAAELLKKAAATNEEKNAGVRLALNEGRERIARAYSILAAIDRGLLPATIADELTI